MEIYEYLFTGFIIISILIGSTAMVTIMSEPWRGISEREQLKVAAQKVMTQLILEPGNPPEWGREMLGEDGLSYFGLAKYSETTRDAYTLDPDKVQRLDNTTRLYIHPSKALELLKISGSYGLRLEFRPALEVNLTRLSNSEYTVSVSTPYTSTPIAWASLAAAMYTYEDGGFRVQEPTGGPLRTGVDGRCTIRFEESAAEMRVIVLAVEHQGVRVVRVAPAGSQVERARLLAGHILLQEDNELEEEALEIALTRTGNTSTLIGLSRTLSRVGPSEYMLDYLEASTEAVLAVSADGSRLYYAPRMEELVYSSVEGENPIPFSYSIERSVLIGGSLYTVRLYLWRVTW